MAINDLPTSGLTPKSVPEILNSSYDPSARMLVFEPMTLNPVTGSLERQSSIQGNASLTVTEVVVGTVTTTTITKTIGSTSYTKTVAKDSSDNSVNVSAWSEV